MNGNVRRGGIKEMMEGQIINKERMIKLEEEANGERKLE
jgi:hypothetical protein